MSKPSLPGSTVLLAILLNIVLQTTVLAAEKAEQAVNSARLVYLEEQAGVRTPDMILELALAYDERGQTAKAMQYYLQAAEQGVGAAELRLGWLYESGWNGGQSYTMALAHYQRAVAAGVVEANLRLGLLYLDGWGVTRDVPTAVKHLQAAAIAGYQPAQKILSEMYCSGVGVATDLKQALAWAEKAAAKQDPEAQTLVGAIRQKAARLPQDIQAAREWYQLSAEQEYTVGMRAMAATFLKPGANPDDEMMGLRWLELATENGDATAAFYLAGMYLWNQRLRTEAGSQDTVLRLLKQSAVGSEMAAAEVLEMRNGGQSLADAYRYVTTVPIEARYIQRLAAESPAPGEHASGDAQPRPIKMVQPIYPAAMKLTKTDGEVTVEFIVDKTGRVRNAHAVASTHQAFTDPAIASMEAWRFFPGRKAGRPVNSRVQLRVIFTMSGAGGLYSEKIGPKAEGS